MSCARGCVEQPAGASVTVPFRHLKQCAHHELPRRASEGFESSKRSVNEVALKRNQPFEEVSDRGAILIRNHHHVTFVLVVWAGKSPTVDENDVRTLKHPPGLHCAQKLEPQPNQPEGQGQPAERPGRSRSKTAASRSSSRASSRSAAAAPYPRSRPQSVSSAHSSTFSLHELQATTVNPLSDDDEDLEEGKIAESLAFPTPRGPQQSKYRVPLRQPSPTPAPRRESVGSRHSARSVHSTHSIHSAHTADVEDVDMTDVQPPAMDKLSFIALPPLGMDDCPHKNAPAVTLAQGAAQPAFGLSEGDWETPHVQLNVALSGWPADVLALYKTAPEDRVIVVLFLGGDFVLSRWYDDIPGKLLEVLGTVVDTTGILVQRPASKPNDKAIRDKYAGHRSVILRVPDRATRDAITRFGTMPVDNELAFHVLPADPTKLTWVVGHFSSSILANEVWILNLLRWLVASFIMTGTEPGANAARTRISRATQHLGGSATSRIYTVARSIFVRYVEAGNRSFFLLLMKPCTDDMELWDAIRQPLRNNVYTDVDGSFTPHGWVTGKVNNIPHPMCVICELDTHKHELCTFRNAPGWSGPRDVLKMETTGRFMQREKATTGAPNRGRGNARGNGRRS
ncbi:hypothetical protein C8F01DRAFT_1226630 [Mycena amicta]|nr:hypothetical protein C8F01DRAFT_1226630 [Mycena amicta]